MKRRMNYTSAEKKITEKKWKSAELHNTNVLTFMTLFTYFARVGLISDFDQQRIWRKQKTFQGRHKT